MYLQNVLIFALGMFAQAFYMLLGRWRKGDFKKILIAFGTGLFGMVPGKNEDNYDLNFHLFISCVFAAVTFTSMFSRRLVSRVGARTILILNIILLFLVYDKFGFSFFIFGVLLIPTLLTLINSFSNLDKTFHFQVFFYVWFSIILVCIGMLHFAFSDLFKTFGFFESVGYVDPLPLIFIGGAFLYIISNMWYVFLLVPMTGKRQTMKNRMINIRKHMQLMAHGYIWEKDDLLGNIVTVIVLPLVLILNYKFAFFSEQFFISTILVILPFLSLGAPSMHQDDGVGFMSEI